MAIYKLFWILNLDRVWELDCKEGWVPNNWCVWTVVLEKILESPLDCKEIQPVHSKDQLWVFFGRNDAKAETPVLWPPHAKSWLIGKNPDAGRDWGQEEKGTTEDEMAEWHHRLDGRESEWTRKLVMDGRPGVVWFMGSQESQTRLSDWTELTWWSIYGFPGGYVARNPPAKQEIKIRWKRKWQSTPVFLPGKYWRVKELEGYNPLGYKSYNPF